MKCRNFLCLTIIVYCIPKNRILPELGNGRELAQSPKQKLKLPKTKPMICFSIVHSRFAFTCVFLIFVLWEFPKQRFPMIMI